MGVFQIHQSPTMGCLVYLSLVTLLSCGIQGASLPYKNGYEYHFNEMGVRLDLAMKDVNPLVGGKAHIELPVSAVRKMLEKDAPLYEPVIDVVEKATLPVWKLLEVEAPYLKPLLIALEKHTVGKLYDVMTVKADITFNAEKVLHGIFNVAVDYTIVHRDGTEERATLLIQGKNQAGQIVTSLEIIPKTDVDMTKKIFYPLEMIFTCDWPSAHTLTIKGDFGKIFLKIANDMNEVSVRGILEYLGQQYKYTTVLSIKEKMFTATFQEPTKEPFDFVMKFKMWKGYPRIEMIGTLPTSPYFTAGVFKTEMIVNNWLNYELKHIFNDVEMLNLTFKMLKGLPRLEIPGTMPTSRYFTAGVFKTEVIVKNVLNYRIKHVFNGVEMLNLTFKMLKGLPRLEITGTMPNTRFFTAGAFKTEVIVNNMLNYEFKHVFNGVEMLNLTFKMLKGLPRLEITGTMPTSRYFTAGVFKTEVIINNLLDYDLKHIFNGMEMLSMEFKMLNGFPRLQITGTMPSSRFFAPGVFKTDVIVNNWLNFDIKHIFNDMEMLSLTLNELNGFPRLEITGTMLALQPILPAGVFKTEVIVNNWLNYEIKHIFDDMEMLNLKYQMMNGFPRVEIAGTMPTLPILPAGVFKTEVIVNNWVDYEIKHIFNDMEMLNVVFKMLNGFPRLAITGTMPTVPFLPAGVFKTEVIANSRFNYEIKHIFNDMEMLKITFKMVKGFPRIEIAGKMPTLPIIPTGAFKTEIIAKNWKNYDIRHIFNGMQMLNLKIAIINGKMEMIGKYGMTHKTHLVMEYEYMRWVKIMLPTTNTWLSKEFGIEMHYQPTNEAKLLEGGNIKIVAMLEKLPIITIGGYYGLTLDSSKYEILLKDFHIKLNQEIILFNGFTISELQFYGKMVFNYISMHDMLQNGMLPKLSVETMVHKDEKLIYQYLFTTIESPYKLRVFYPFLFKSILGLPHEHIDITHEHVVLGSKQVATTICNLTTKKLITTVTPTMMAFELFDGEISLVKYVTELTKIEVGRNAMLLEGTKTVQFNASQPMLLPKILGFNKLKTKFHLEVVDKAAGKVNINVAVIKDTTELLNAVVNNVQAPYMIVLKAPVLAVEMRLDYEMSTKVWNVMINNKTYMMVKPTVPNEVEVIVFGFPVVKVALLADEVKITTIIPKLPEIGVAFLTNGIKITAIIPDLPEITTAVTLKTFSLFQNTLGIEVMIGKMSHKTLFGWNFNILRKAFVDVKLIGSGIEVLGDYEVFHHLNWNIVGLKNIDVEWTGKVLCPAIKFFKTPLVTEGKLVFKNFIVDLKMVEKLMDVPYTVIFKTKPLTVALLPFFQYP